MKKRALYICGSINQTTQLHDVSRQLPELEASFTPFYGDRIVDWMRRMGLVEQTIAGNKRRGWCVEYLRDNNLDIDMRGERGGYDLVVTCTDLVVPKNVRATKLLCVQEGILDPEDWQAWVCRRLKFLPRWAAGTVMTGESFLYDRYCVASEGYRDQFIARGADPEKIVVTGMPNFDDCRRYRDNDFPHHNFVLVCTSDTRETFKRDDRPALIRRALEIAKGRKLIFKLHPNEKRARAEKEIHEIAPNALVYQSGSAEEMIANCDVLITQWSSTVFVGMALDKEVYSNFSIDELRRLAPIQNGGTAATRIAHVCRDLLGEPGPKMRLIEGTDAPKRAARTSAVNQ